FHVTGVQTCALPICGGGGAARLFVHPLAQVDAVLEPYLERAQHLAPALAVAVARIERTLGLAPAFLGDLDQRAPVFERLEGHRRSEERRVGKESSDR